jgi:hypothetical protein
MLFPLWQFGFDHRTAAFVESRHQLLLRLVPALRTLHDELAKKIGTFANQLPFGINAGRAV